MSTNVPPPLLVYRFQTPGPAPRHQALPLQCRQDDFLKHYHKRSNVESSFSACKRKFGDSVRSKNDHAMVSEVLCKLLAFNLCCLTRQQCILGIEPVFWPAQELEEVKKGEAIGAEQVITAESALPTPAVPPTPIVRQVRRLSAIVS